MLDLRWLLCRHFWWESLPILQSQTQYPRLAGFTTPLLQWLILKQVWKHKLVWDGVQGLELSCTTKGCHANLNACHWCGSLSHNKNSFLTKLALECARNGHSDVINLVKTARLRASCSRPPFPKKIKAVPKNQRRTVDNRPETTRTCFAAAKSRLIRFMFKPMPMRMLTHIAAPERSVTTLWWKSR